MNLESRDFIVDMHTLDNTDRDWSRSVGVGQPLTRSAIPNVTLAPTDRFSEATAPRQVMFREQDLRADRSSEDQTSRKLPFRNHSTPHRDQAHWEEFTPNSYRGTDRPFPQTPPLNWDHGDMGNGRSNNVSRGQGMQPTSYGGAGASLNREPQNS